MRLGFWVAFGFLLFGQFGSAFDLFGIFGGSSASKKPKHELEPVSADNAKNYLQNFGYVQPSALLGSAPRGMAADFGDSLKSAIRKFQEFAGLASFRFDRFLGLSPSGELDIRTRKKMAEPRCGVLDVRALSSTREDVFKWKKSRLTYSIFSYSNDLPHDQITKAVRKAFETWSAVVPLDFIEVSNHDESADIKVKFASGSHGDPWPFDGKGGVLAHATMPTSGLLHFDEDENWVYMDADKIASYRYTDLLPVAMHEIGHVLGLEHARTDDSIMAPFYQETVDSDGNYVMPKLHTVDITAIRDIYGPRRGKFVPSSDSGSDSDWSPPPTTTQRPFRTTTEKSRGGGLFDSLWSRWMGNGNSDRDRNRTPKERVTDSDDSDSNRPSGFGFGGGRGSSGRSRPTDSDSDDSNGHSGFGFGGSRSSGGKTTTPDSTLDGNFDGCPSMVDALTDAPGGTMYLFSGSRVYELRGKKILRVHSLRLLFPKGPIYVEAAYFNRRSNVMVLFQSYKVFVFDMSGGRFELDSGYPKQVPRDMGFNPTGGLTWVDGSHLLFSRGEDFAVYDEYWNQATKVDTITRYFPGLPRGIRGGFTDGGTATVFTMTSVRQYDGTRKMAFGGEVSLQSYLNC